MVPPPSLPPTARSFILPSLPESLVNHLSYHNTDRLRDGLTSSNINRYQLQLRMKEAPTEQEREGRRRESRTNGRKPEIRKQGMSARARECEERARHCTEIIAMRATRTGGAAAPTFRVKLSRDARGQNLLAQPQQW